MQRQGNYRAESRVPTQPDLVALSSPTGANKFPQIQPCVTIHQLNHAYCAVFPTPEPDFQCVAHLMSWNGPQDEVAFGQKQETMGSFI